MDIQTKRCSIRHSSVHNQWFERLVQYSHIIRISNGETTINQSMLKSAFIDFIFSQLTSHTHSFRHVSTVCMCIYLCVFLLPLAHCATSTSVEHANRCSCAYVSVSFQSTCAICYCITSAQWALNKWKLFQHQNVGMAQYVAWCALVRSSIHRYYILCVVFIKPVGWWTVLRKMVE